MLLWRISMHVDGRFSTRVYLSVLQARRKLMG